MPHRILSVAAFAVLAVAVTACGGGAAAANPSSPTATAVTATSEPTEPAATPAQGGGVEGDLTPGTTLDACEIVTPDDIKAATASTDPVPAGTLQAKPDTLSPGKTECTYEGDYGRIIVQLVPEDGANLWDAARGAYKDASDISAIGDGAFNSAANNRAFIWQGKVNVMLTMFLNGDLEQLAVATALGKAIVSKL